MIMNTALLRLFRSRRSQTMHGVRTVPGGDRKPTATVPLDVYSGFRNV